MKRSKSTQKQSSPDRGHKRVILNAEIDYNDESEHDAYVTRFVREHDIHRVTFHESCAGTIDLTFPFGDLTDIAYDATQATIQAALDAQSSDWKVAAVDGRWHFKHTADSSQQAVTIDDADLTAGFVEIERTDWWMSDVIVKVSNGIPLKKPNIVVAEQPSLSLGNVCWSGWCPARQGWVILSGECREYG